MIGLKVHDIHATQSCEGHENWGTGGPYIDIESPLNDELHDQLHEYFISNTDDPEMENIRDKCIINNLIERKKLTILLSEFYKDRIVDFDIRLIISSLGLSRSRLENQGVDMQKIENDSDIKNERLISFQLEMEAFKNFLKDKFFQN